jgi:hypothetical protein
MTMTEGRTQKELEAAEALTASTALAQVLSAIAVYPMSADDLEILLRLSTPRDPGRKASRLKTLGLAELTGERRLTRNLNEAVVYTPTGLGRHLADPWPGPPPESTIRQRIEADTTPVVGNGTDQSWACPIHRQAFGNPRGLLLHFGRYCDRITVNPRQDVIS